MEKELKKKVLAKLDELLSTVKESQTYQDYLYLENKMKQNKEINEYIRKIKACQKEAVKAHALKNEEKERELDKKIKILLQELEEYPLYIDFVKVQKELDSLFQVMHIRLENYFKEKTN